MLDEKLEYKQITIKDDLQYTRLKYSTLSDGLSGIERPMTIVARNFIWGGFAEELDDRVFITKVALRAWCGHKYETTCYRLIKGKSDQWEFCRKEEFDSAKISEEHQVIVTTPLNEKIYIEIDPESKYKTKEAILNKCPELFSDKISCHQFANKVKKEIERIDDWLPKYIKKLTTESEKPDENPVDKNKKTVDEKRKATGKTKEEKGVDLIKMLRSKKYGRKLFNYKFGEFDTDGIKTITYEKIIANALNEGPLKTFRLKCDSKLECDENALKDIQQKLEKLINSFESKKVPAKMSKGVVQSILETIKKETEEYFNQFPNHKKSLEEIFCKLRGVSTEKQKTYKGYIDKLISDAQKADMKAKQCQLHVPTMFENVQKEIVQENGTKEKVALTGTEQRHLLMLTAYYLIESAKYEKKGNRHKIWFNKTDFMNWSGWNVSTKMKEAFVYQPEDESDASEEYLFSAEGFDNTIKLKVNHNWLKKYKLEIVEQLEGISNPNGIENQNDKMIISLSEQDLIFFGKKGKKRKDENVN